MDTEDIKVQVDKQIERLTSLRDEVKVQLHLASLEAKKEWDEKLAPKLFEVEQSAKNIAETPRTELGKLITKMEDFLARIRDPKGKSDGAPYSTH